MIEGKDKDIKSLQREIATIQAGHDKEKDEIKQRMYEAVKALMRVDDLFPHVKGLLKMGKLLQGCRAGQGADQSAVYDAALPIHRRTAFDKV